jgi:hypothetical protein
MDDWSRRLTGTLNMQIVELTGETLPDQRALQHAQVFFFFILRCCMR